MEAAGKPDPDRQLLEIAQRQFGVVTCHQATAVGLSHQGLIRRVAKGMLVRLHPEIYAIKGVPRSPHQTLLGAVLWGGPGSAASHRAAAWLWDLDRDEPAFEITTPRRLRSAVVVAHRRDPVEARDLVQVQGIPTTSVDRTILDLAAVADIDELEDALDAALRKRLTSLARLRLRLRNEEGRRGMRNLRALLRDREADGGPSHSRFETRLNRLLLSRGLPALRQYTIWDGGKFVARVDFCYPEAKLIVEADSLRWHSSRRAWQRDIERRNHMTALGWQVLHVTWEDLTRRPDQTVARIRALLQPQLPIGH